MNGPLTIRFWQYQSYKKKNGIQAEHWVSKHSYERKKIHTVQIQELALARREFNKMQLARREA